MHGAALGGGDPAFSPSWAGTAKDGFENLQAESPAWDSPPSLTPSQMKISHIPLLEILSLKLNNLFSNIPPDTLERVIQ